MSAVPAAETLPVAVERPGLSEQERYYFASQWQLIWWRLRRHRFAMISLWFLVALYATIPFVEFLAPSSSGAATRTTSTPHLSASTCFTRAGSRDRSSTGTFSP